ncbi:VOC family protein [Rhizobiales bacterium RZME27]|jgi:catechol 2,3-dioxygenase|uniref:VOC family protein n=1 Tax=Endobacterium cereale TaxID=2663029 RepID=A0A6A8A8E4_9HYPH|nr:VOC family protein [Endobacterium cereale]MEB2847090.1 VOC family protein [Endobacterium cereale]MQY47493.1 VOC family protein [Endobacterium cereale]
MPVTRRHILTLAGVTTAAAALPGALAAEGITDTTPTKATLPFALTTPIHCGEVAIRVRHLDNMVAYYRAVLGLAELSSTKDGATLGVAGTPLLHLITTPDAKIEPVTSAGLYHVAYLMPNRAELARWLVHIAMTKVPVSGFADHNVSEAVYLMDPEGNGIEVYSDRPRENWQWNEGVVTMGSEPLDIDGILALADTKKDTFTAAPDLLRIGHMHLKVGDLQKGDAFYVAAAGLVHTRKGREDAAFLSSGGYHHHVAMNMWHSKGAGARRSGQTGLAWFSLAVSDHETLEAQRSRFEAAGFAPKAIADGRGFEVTDPWGTGLRLVPV